MFRAALRALDPADRVAAALAADPVAERSVVALAFGKAAPRMLAGARRILGDRIARSACATVEGTPAEREQMIAGHPEPDQRSQRAGLAALSLARSVSPDQRMLVLVSGGGSALLAVPAAGLSLSDKAAACAAIAAAGAPIAELNAVRKHLSAIKGGQLAAACPAPVTTLIASDVIGDDPAVVASGPTVPDPTTFADALAIAARAPGLGALPPAVVEQLQRGAAGDVAETPKLARPGDRFAVIAGTAALVEAAAGAARDAGARVEVLPAALAGDVAEVAQTLADRVSAAIAGGHGGPFCLVAGGEPTIVLPRARKRGGRAHHLALLVAEKLRGVGRFELLVAGSDGQDGASGAAGAVIGPDTWDEALRRGLDPAEAVAHHDSATLLGALGASVPTGPTGLNHADLVVIWLA